jgi:signal transduction histidine kinase
MSADRQPIKVESIPLQEIAADLRRTHPFAETDLDSLSGVDQVDRVNAPAGSVLVEPWQTVPYYWVVLDGEIRADRAEPGGSRTTVGFARSGDGFGEAPLLTGKTHSPLVIETVRDSTLVRFTEDQFWALMAGCPDLRKVVLANLAQRLEAFQVEALHRDKLISLGTMAAGLMHELHNPGSAAKRAASQLRENLLRLQQLSLRFSGQPKTQDQLDCMRSLLEHALHGCHAPALGTLEQSDAEEAMAEWLKSAGVENAYSIAPALVGIGFEQQELSCAKEHFAASAFSDTLNWLHSLVSSVSLVCAIEESIARISDLVMAVKKFAYDERSAASQMDVHDNLQSTLIILGHKLRNKQISVVKRFAAAPSTIHTRGSALGQVWTNLIDNAIDASPQNAEIQIATWTEAATATVPARLAVSITDRGEGIPPDVLPHIFEPFFTTKPQGAGTGLGLEIVHRIVTQKFGGTIEVESEPGRTRFTVRLPLDAPAKEESPATPSAP